MTAALTIANSTTSTITLTAIPGADYSIDGGTGEPSPIFTVQLPERLETPNVALNLRDLTANTTKNMEYSTNGGKNSLVVPTWTQSCTWSSAVLPALSS